MQPIIHQPIAVTRHPPGPRRRHWARVVRFSRDVALLDRLDQLAITDHGVPALVGAASELLGVEPPRLRFHARRSPYTGACERPRSMWVQLLGEEELAWREQNGWGRVPDQGAIRLGRTTTLMTLAHELAHHVSFELDPASTPAHGRVWVGRFDQAAAAIRGLVAERS